MYFGLDSSQQLCEILKDTGFQSGTEQHIDFLLPLDQREKGFPTPLYDEGRWVFFVLEHLPVLIFSWLLEVVGWSNGKRQYRDLQGPSGNQPSREGLVLEFPVIIKS